MAEDRNPDDDFILPIGQRDIKGKKLRDIPLTQLDNLLGWLEDKQTRPDLQKILAKYLEDNQHDA